MFKDMLIIINKMENFKNANELLDFIREKTAEKTAIIYFFTE